MNALIYDLVIVGGGINGAGIARDAAGRGLSVLLAERDDLAAHTSSWSTKLIHGGLRYLEYRQFRLVAEALAERDVLLTIAPHLIEPLAFVLPHEPHLRPAWMIRAGLFLYDRLGGASKLPRSASVQLAGSRWGAGLAPRFVKGFVYADAKVDDARLVVANALSAQAHGAKVRTHTAVTGARREGDHWRVTLAGADGDSEVQARALVNAAGPWVKAVLETVGGVARDNVRHVKGSHIVVPRIHPEEHAYILQNADKRIVFIIPFQQDYSLIGTTDIAVDSYADPQISESEIDYLLALANSYLAVSLVRDDIVWTYSGVRPLHDDGSTNPSAVTRDYVLKLDAGGAGDAPPLLSIFGGKITTYRTLAEAALRDLAPFFPAMKPAWTATEALPGGDFPEGDRTRFLAGLCARYPGMPAPLLRALLARHGTRTTLLLGDAQTPEDLGRDFGGTLTEREFAFLVQHEWAASAEDVLWRRTKCGLPMTAAQRAAVAAHGAEIYGWK
jgi:glycerol-3-phosphate dehydrogenase